MRLIIWHQDTPFFNQPGQLLRLLLVFYLYPFLTNIVYQYHVPFFCFVFSGDILTATHDGLRRSNGAGFKRVHTFNT